MDQQKLTARLNEIRCSGPQRRTASVVYQAWNADARTAELAFSSETESVERWFGIEVLGHAPGELDLGRLNSGAPVLWDHNWRDQRGVVESARIDADGVGRAVVRFSRSAEGEQLFQDIVDGIVTKVSVGYIIKDLRVVEERDGVPVYRVTDWEPYEISMVSVPADDTVGVGRTADFPALIKRSASPAQNRKPRNEPNVKPIHNLLTGARVAQADVHKFNEDGTLRGFHRRTPATVDHLDMRSLEISTALEGGGRPTVASVGTQAGRILTFSEAVIAYSLFAQAGGQVLMPPEQSVSFSMPDGGLAWQREIIDFEVVTPSKFQRLPDGADAEETAFPVARTTAERDAAPTYAARHMLTRTERREFKDGHLADTAALALALGVARIVDEIALKTILWNGLGNFSLAGAASAGLAFGNLRAIAGTGATGAQIDGNGALRVNGIAAEFTDTIAESVIGDFHRCAVVVGPRLTLTAERMNLRSDLNLVAMISAEALVPAPGSFFLGV